MSSPRIAVIITGVLFVLAGLGTAAAGGGLLALFGGDSQVSSGRHALSTPTTALVSEVADISDTSDLASVVGRPKVGMSVEAASRDKGVFVGIGPAADVDRYLASSPIDEVTDLEVDPFVLDRSPRSGTKRPAPPADQKFWVAQGAGRDTAALDWKVRDGDYRVVVMNADGSRGVNTAGSVDLEVPHLPTIAWILMGSGLVLLLGGATAIIGAVVTRPDEVAARPEADA